MRKTRSRGNSARNSKTKELPNLFEPNQSNFFPKVRILGKISASNPTKKNVLKGFSFLTSDRSTREKNYKKLRKRNKYQRNTRRRVVLGSQGRRSRDGAEERSPPPHEDAAKQEACNGQTITIKLGRVFF